MTTARPSAAKMRSINLSRSIKVEQFRDTSLISIQVYREDPEEAARIANEVAAVYRDQRLTAKRHEVKRAIEVLESEVQKQQERVERAEQELEKIRKRPWRQHDLQGLPGR